LGLIPDFFGNEKYPDSAKAHIADAGKEYQDLQNSIG
jgi:phage-related tail protein